MYCKSKRLKAVNVRKDICLKITSLISKWESDLFPGFTDGPSRTKLKQI